MFTGSEDIVHTTRQRIMEERMAVNEIALKSKSSEASSRSDTNPLTGHDEFSEYKIKVKSKDVITIKEEAVDSSPRSDDNNGG